jgi:hypothetical protein
VSRNESPVHRAIYRMAMSGGFACPCCGYLTLTEPAAGTYEICPICYWEDDATQFHAPDSTIGANAVSLATARANFASLGVSDPRFRDRVRAPTPDETP